MNRENFRPELYISIGATGAMFTMRQTYLHEDWYRGNVTYEVRSFHHFNLGQDKNASMEKALTFSREKQLPMITTMDRLETEFSEIHRRTPEEVEEETRRYRAIRAKHDNDYAERRDGWYMDRLVKKGNIWKMGFGKYSDRTIQEVAELDPEYLMWLESNETTDSLIFAMIEFQFEKQPYVKVESEYFGDVGTRYPFKATIKNVTGFDGAYGWTSVITMMTENGEALVIFTTASFPKVGEKCTFNAKVKEHKEYRDVKQTVLQRPTKITEI